MTDQTARPIRTADEIRACGHTPAQHRTIDGLEADLRTTTREHGEALEQLTQAWAALNQAGLAGPGSVAQHIAQLAEQRDVARHLVELRTAALSRRTGDLRAAVRVVDAVRTGTLEDIDRAMAAYDAPADLAGPVYARRQTAAEGPNGPGEGMDKGDAATEAHRGAEDGDGWLDDALETADSVLVDNRDRIWRTAPDGTYQRRPFGNRTRASLDAQYGPTQAAMLIYLDGPGHVCHPIECACELSPADAPPGSAEDRAQGEAIRPADWEQRAVDAARDALAAAWPNLGAGAVAEVAVRAIIDAGLAGPGGRCPACGQTYPRTIPAGEDQRCWTCSAEPTPAEIAEHRPTVAKVLADVRAGRPATTREG